MDITKIALYLARNTQVKKNKLIFFSVFSPPRIIMISKYLLHRRSHSLFYSICSNYHLKMSSFGWCPTNNKHIIPILYSNHITNLTHRNIMKLYFDIFSSNNFNLRFYISIFISISFTGTDSCETVNDYHKKKAEIHI